MSTLLVERIPVNHWLGAFGRCIATMRSTPRWSHAIIRVDVLSVITQSYIFIDIGLKRLKTYVDQRLNMVELQEKSDCLGHFQEQAIGNMERVTGRKTSSKKTKLIYWKRPCGATGTKILFAEAQY